MQHYELLYILPGTLAENEVPTHMETMKAILSTAGATNIAITDGGKNRLAYPMRHIRYGYFSVVRFEAEAPALAQIQGKLRLLPEPLRALIQSVDPKSDPALHMAQVVGRAPEEVEAEVERKRTHVTPEVAPVRESAAPVAKATPVPTVSAEEIDKKLDEILAEDIASV